MNNQRRNRIKKCIKLLDYSAQANPIDIGIVQVLRKEIDGILNDEEESFECIPDNLKDSMKGEDSQDAISCMYDAIDNLEKALKETDQSKMFNLIYEAVDNLEDIY